MATILLNVPDETLQHLTRASALYPAAGPYPRFSALPGRRPLPGAKLPYPRFSALPGALAPLPAVGPYPPQAPSRN